MWSSFDESQDDFNKTEYVLVRIVIEFANNVTALRNIEFVIGNVYM